MSRKNKPKRFLPPVKPAPPIPVEPPDIAEEANLTPAEKAMLASDLQKFGTKAGKGISSIPAEYKAANVPNVPEPVSKQNGSVFMESPNPIEMQKVGEQIGSLMFRKREERSTLAQAFDRMAANAAVGNFNLFDGITIEGITEVQNAYQQAVTNLLIRGNGKPVEPLDLRGLVALTYRSQEDRHNRRALLDLCARLDISAEELTLAILRENLNVEGWRLGEVAAEIPELDPTPENEVLWNEYKAELGLIKRKKVTNG